MKSIRRHLLVHLASHVLPLVVAGCLALLLMTRYLLIAEFDAGLRAQTGALASMAERVGKGLDFDYDIEALPDFVAHPSPDYFEIWASDGSLLKRSASLGGRDLEMPAFGGEGPHIRPFRLPDGRMGRACALTFEARIIAPADHLGEVDRPVAPPGPLRIVVARGTEMYTSSLWALGAGLPVMALLLVAGIMVVNRRSVERGLLPLETLANQATRIEPSSLNERFDVPSLPRELRPIAARLNDLLARLEAAFERERGFAAGAAHELRTPVAEVRALAEVALRWPAGGQQAATNLHGIVEVTEGMERTIATLLAIGRARNGSLPVRVSTLDVSRVVDEQWARRTDKAATRSLRAAVHLDPSLWVETDPAAAKSIVSNLLDNAIDYTPPGGDVMVEVVRENGCARLRVENTGTNLDASDLPHLFDPFWRKDPSRSEEGHSGLGLALVSALCDAVGAKVRARLPGPGLFEVSVWFRSAPEATPSPGADTRQGNGAPSEPIAAA